MVVKNSGLHHGFWSCLRHKWPGGFRAVILIKALEDKEWQITSKDDAMKTVGICSGSHEDDDR